MTSRGRCVVDARVAAELATSGAPYEIKRGRRHVKVLVAGRLAAIPPVRAEGPSHRELARHRQRAGGGPPGGAGVAGGR